MASFVPDSFSGFESKQERSDLRDGEISSKTVRTPTPVQECAAQKPLEVGYPSSLQHQGQMNHNQRLDPKIPEIPGNSTEYAGLPNSTDNLSSSESDCDQLKDQTSSMFKKAFEEATPGSTKYLPSCLTKKNSEKSKLDRNLLVGKIADFVSLKLSTHKSVFLRPETVKQFARRNDIGDMEICGIQDKSDGIVDFLYNIIVRMRNKQGDRLTAQKIVNTLKESDAVLLAQELEKELGWKH